MLTVSPSAAVSFCAAHLPPSERVFSLTFRVKNGKQMGKLHFCHFGRKRYKQLIMNGAPVKIRTSNLLIRRQDKAFIGNKPR
jgi:hypothetical protein